jgi:hypothetical protein
VRPDQVNAFFEGGGACLQLLNCRQLLRDRVVRGAHWLPLAFWTSWGCWNLFYYPSIGQSWSFVAGTLVFLVNGTNLFLMWRFWPRQT